MKREIKNNLPSKFISLTLFFLILFSLNFVSADWGYNSLKTGIRTSNINQTTFNNTYYINGSNINASSFSTACSGTNKVSNVTYSNFTGLFTIVCTIDETSAGGSEPLWSANYTLFNSTWSSTFNSTYNDAWKYATNNSFYPRTSNPFGYLNTSTETNWNANYSTFLTHINWGQATNGTLMLSANWNATNTSYYLVTNPFSFYNITSWNNPYSYYNSTDFVITNYLLTSNKTLNGNYSATDFCLTGGSKCLSGITGTTEADPFWSANFTLYNSSWSSINNATYNEAWLLATNGTFYKRITNEYNYTNKTLLSQFTNDLTFYVDNTHSYFNLTNFPNYANVYLNISNQYGYINLTTLAGNETDSKAYNGTLAYNSSLAGYYPYYSNPYGYLNTSGAEVDPKWSGNLSNFSSVYSYVTNGTFYLATNPSSYITWGNAVNGTLATWTQVMNGTVMKQITYDSNYSTLYLASNPYIFWNSTFATFNKTYADTLYQPIGTYIDQTYGNATYYLKTNPFSFYNSTNFPYTSLSNFTNNMGLYNITSWNNPYTYFNLTNFPNYANIYLNTSNQFSYFNLTSFPNYANVYLNTTNQFSYYNSTSWNNPFTYFNLTNFPNYANVYLNTTNQYSYYNTTSIPSFITWDKVINGTTRLSINNTFYGNVDINSAGNLNITAGNSTVFLGRIKLGIDTQNCAGLVSGEICRNSTAVYIKG